MQQTILTPDRVAVAGGRARADIITVEIRSVFGIIKAYPVCPRARIFADIAGTTTLTRAALNLVEALGFEIVSIANADWRKAQ